MPVHGNVVHLHTDAALAHLLEHLATPSAEDAGGVEVPDGVDAVAYCVRLHTVDAGEIMLVALEDLASTHLELLQTLQLRQAEGGVHVGQAVVEAPLVHLLVPRTLVGIAHTGLIPHQADEVELVRALPEFGVHRRDGDPSLAVSALDAAVAAQADWAATEPRERAELLRRAYEAIIARKDDFATLMTLEMGKPLAEAYGEVTYGAEYFRWFSEEAVRIHGRNGISPVDGQRIVTSKVPVGPVFAITPWNFPLAMATRKIGPALAAGCTVVVKPAIATPLTTLLLMEVLMEVGLPDGVVNVFTTSDSKATSAAVIADRRLRKLTFTGSTGVGQALLAQAAENVLRTSMELGGNAPFIVLADADLDEAVEGALIAKMRNNGEACTAANRFYLHESIADEFLAKLTAKLEDWPVGPGIDEGSKLGALITGEAVDDIVELIDDAVDKGAELVMGGKRLEGDGNFLPPTILTGITQDSRIAHEEIFGPMVATQTFTDVDDVVSRANDTDFGLMAYVSNAAAPFGGVKHSGLGREGASEGIEEYLETKYYGIPA